MTNRYVGTDHHRNATERRTFLWIGGLNIKVRNDDQGIKGNYAEITRGGRRIQQLIKRGICN